MQINKLALPVKTRKVFEAGGRTTYPSQNTRIQKQELFHFPGRDTNQDRCTRP